MMMLPQMYLNQHLQVMKTKVERSLTWMTVTSTKMIQSSSAWLTIVSDFFIKCASFVCLYPFMQLALYISVVRPPFHLFCGGIWAPNLMGKVYFWRILASSTGDYFLAIIRRLSPTRQQLARRLVGEANSGSKTIRSKSGVHLTKKTTKPYWWIASTLPKMLRVILHFRSRKVTFPCLLF